VIIWAWFQVQQRLSMGGYSHWDYEN